MKVRSPPSDRPQAEPRSADSPVADDERVDLSEASDDQQGRLDSGATYASAPAGRAGEQLKSGVSLYELGRDIGGTIGNGTGEATGGLSTGGAWGSVSVDSDKARDTRSNVNAYYEPGWLSGGGSHEWASSDGGRRGAAGSLALWDGGVGASASFDVTRADGVGIDLGVFVGLDADRSITDLGVQPDGQRRVEVSRTRGRSAFLSPGVFGDIIGLGVRFGGGKTRTVVYRTSVPPEEAQRLLTEKQGIVGWARDTARGIGFKDDPVIIPDLRAPETLAIGDELVTTTTGELRAGLFIGGLPFRLGAQGRVNGDFEVGVKRLDEHRVSFVVTPRQVRGLMGRIGVPIALDGDLSRVTARAMRQAFVFDLREPGAREAYARALDGELPGGIPSADRAADGEDALDLHAAVAAEVLPAGVERSYAELVHAKRTQMGIGFAVGLWHRSGPFVGLGQQHVTSENKSEVVTDAGVWTRDVRGTERRRQLLISGEETRGVFAALKRSTTFDERGAATHAFGGLALELRLGDTRVRGMELNGDVIDVLNDAFGLALPPFERAGRKKTREVTVARTLTAEDLATLADSTGDALAALRDELGAATEDVARAESVQAFIADKGLRGFAAVCAALGGSAEDYDVATTSSAYEAPVSTAAELALNHATPIDGADSKRDLTRRFTEVDEALTEVREGIADAQNDPLLDDREAERLTLALGRAQETLRGLITTTHLDTPARDALIDRLDAGWTTGRQHRLIERLGTPPASGHAVSEPA